MAEYADTVAVDDVAELADVDDEVLGVNNYFETLQFATATFTDDEGVEWYFLYFYEFHRSLLGAVINESEAILLRGDQFDEFNQEDDDFKFCFYLNNRWMCEREE